MIIKRGSIFNVALGEKIGSVQCGVRPVLIIQNDIGNKYSPTVLVAPLTSKVKSKHHLPTHVLVKSERIKYNSIVLLEQIRVLDKSRLISYVDTLTKEEIRKLDIGIIKSFNITGECFNDANILF